MTPPAQDEPLEIFDLEEGVGMMLPENWSATQMKPEHPATTYLDFRKAQLCEYARPFQMPWSRIACDSTKVSFSGSRMDNQVYYNFIKYVRGSLTRIVLIKLWHLFEADYRLQRPAPAVVRPSWVWDPTPSADPEKDGKARKGRLEDGTSSPQREIAAEGEDPDDVLAEQAEWKRKREELGLVEQQTKNSRAKFFEDIARAVRAGVPIAVAEARVALGLAAKPKNGDLLRFNDQDVLQYHVENPILTINEIRARLDLPWVKWGDVTPAEFLKELRPEPVAPAGGDEEGGDAAEEVEVGK